MSRARYVAVFSMAIAGSMAGGTSLQANQAASTGLDKLHDQARVGGRTCMTDHEHGGEGSLPSKKGASEAAIRHWEGFTIWEYGKTRGSYRLAVGRKMDC